MIDISQLPKIKSGKVRDLYETSSNYVIHHSDRLSSFDRNICNIDGKGELLCKTAKWWFDRTRHIIDNHVVGIEGRNMIVKKCSVILIEFVVRGYITGSTSTSLWTHYNNGERVYCGIEFPDGLKKNQRLAEPVLTPTTKDEHDEPLSCEDIITRKILSKGELNYIKEKALSLFSYGQKEALKRGLILVDTKYEFGYDSNGNIILIDEIHTCDSSRYWKNDSYQERFNAGEEPEKLDKDSVRDYVKKVCDPYKDDIPEIPTEVKTHVYNCYSTLFSKLISNSENLVVIISGSESDKEHFTKIGKELDNLYIPNTSYVCSAHKNTLGLIQILNDNRNLTQRIIYVTVAGRSNALSGVVACNVSEPVIACPPFKDKDDMMVNIHSTLQMPSNVPVMTILEPRNVALTCLRIFDLNN